ncbi:Transcription factor HIVEP3 [Dirofilaria immitis]|nr:Transcription factor HIVEP3 [Dirofilaria immitis]
MTDDGERSAVTAAIAAAIAAATAVMAAVVTAAIAAAVAAAAAAAAAIHLEFLQWNQQHSHANQVYYNRPIIPQNSDDDDDNDDDDNDDNDDNDNGDDDRYFSMFRESLPRDICKNANFAQFVTNCLRDANGKKWHLYQEGGSGSGGSGIGGIGNGLPMVAQPAAIPCGISSGSLRPQDAQAISPRAAASLNAAALAAAQVPATPIPAAHLLYQQFLSAGAVAAQSQLLQGTAVAAAVSQTTPSLPPPTPILPQAAVAAAAAANAVAVAAQQQQQQQSVPSQQQQTASASQSQQQNQAFVLANAAQALAINQLLLQQNPLQQQVQAALAQLLNPFAYYQPHLTALLQQSQLTAASHMQQPQQPPQIQVQNGIGTSVAAQQQQQKMIENLLVEQVVRNPTTHDKIESYSIWEDEAADLIELNIDRLISSSVVQLMIADDKSSINISQPVVADNRNVGLLTSAESVKEHISRLISENEAILEQNPGLIKRRPYHRQVGSQSSIELETGIRSQSNSPGLRDVRLQFTHGQSFYESHKPLAVRVTGGSLTNGHPVVKAPEKYTCNYCELKFPNDAALVAHEIRCSKIEINLKEHSQQSLFFFEYLLIFIDYLDERWLALETASFDYEAEIHSQTASSSASSSTVAAARLQMLQQQNSVNTGIVDRVGRKSNICNNSNAVSSTVLHENRHPLKRRLLAAAGHLDEPQASTSKTAKLETSKSNINVTNPICISLPATHYKTPLIPQRSFNSSSNISAVSEASVPATQTVIIVTSHPASQLVASKNVQTYQRIYSASTISHMFDLSCKLLVRNLVARVTSFMCVGPSAVANKPYILTLNDMSTTRNDGTSRRSRMRNITTETFATLNKPQPMFCEHKPKLSMYSNWQQSTVDSEEAKLNLLYISTCSTKPRMGVKQLWRYTTALREMGVLKVTHSSFWDYSTKMRLRQNAAATATTATSMNSQTVIATFVQERSSTTASTSATVSATNVTSFISPSNPPNGKNDNDINISDKENMARVEKDQNTMISLKEITDKQQSRNRIANESAKTLSQKIVGGYFSNEVYVYVRGRGRGRYVCGRCGIRCNLTKHLQSKTHRRRMVEKEKQKIAEQDSDSDHDRLEIASLSGTASTFSNDPLSDDECSSDEELRPPCDDKNKNMYRKFGQARFINLIFTTIQDNILMERTAHTPPMLWIVGETIFDCSIPNCLRSCHSAPPSARYPSEGRKQQKLLETNFLLKKDTPEDIRSSEVKQPTTSALPVVQTLASTANDCSQLQSLSSFITEQQPSVGAFFAKETIVCDICKRVFRSSTEMTLHRKIHLIGPSNSRIRSYQCSECKYSVRSRNALQRHMEERHGIVESLQTEQLNDSDNEETNTNLSSLNPRSFMCTDCNIGFRKHGILAKHLRSKTHVMKLESLRIIPEDSLSLITRIISTLRDSNALECREQMLHLPVPLLQTTNSNNNNNHNNTNISYSSQQLKIQRSPMPSTSQSVAENKRLLTGQTYTSKRLDVLSTKMPSEISPRKCDMTASQRKADDLNGKSISANVWMPPKLDVNSTSDRRSVDIVGRSTADSAALSDNGSSVRSDEANSEGAGRSESSTPTQRVLVGAAPSPLLPASTRCNLCDVNYESSFDLQVHLHADHIMLRDGKDFCCPKKQCDKVYPSRENLRQHIAAHYHGGATPLPDSRDEIESAMMVLSDASDTSVVLHRKSTNSTPGQHANSVPNHSPNAPEESHTACSKISISSSSTLMSSMESGDVGTGTAVTSNGMLKQRHLIKLSEGEKANGCNTVNATIQDRKWSTSTQLTVTSASSVNVTTASAALPCAICGQSFPDAFALQRHWLSHVCDRPHICKQCDAGFTTADALNTHSLTHQNSRRQR